MRKRKLRDEEKAGRSSPATTSPPPSLPLLSPSLNAGTAPPTIVIPPDNPPFCESQSSRTVCLLPLTLCI